MSAFDPCHHPSRAQNRWLAQKQKVGIPAWGPSDNRVEGAEMRQGNGILIVCLKCGGAIDQRQ